jgi:hypothetical protein
MRETSKHSLAPMTYLKLFAYTFFTIYYDRVSASLLSYEVAGSVSFHQDDLRTLSDSM